MKKLPLTRSVMTPMMIIFLLTSFHTSQAQSFTMKQTLSDGAQRNTIAFDGLAFLTGNFCACSFIPPGKVADYFGFQYLRDNDITQMGHTTDFNTVIADNLLYVLDSTQKASIITLAKAQTSIISEYAYARFPLIKAFIKMRDENGNTILDKEAVKARSAEMYKLDGRISIQRAQLYASIIKNLNALQKHYLDSVKVLGMKNMPVLPEQIDKRPLNNKEFVGAMSIAGDIFAWYAGSIDADVYFCPERQGNYFGGFYIKDAPAMGNHGYSIDTSLTQSGGINFLNALTPSQRGLITGLVDSQRTDLLSLVDRRTEISNLLRGYLSAVNIDTTAVLNLSEIYGALDGEISYYYATNFSKVGWSLSAVQRDTINKLRNLDNYPCAGAYLYSDSIGVPEIDITGLFFSTVGIKLIDFSASTLQNNTVIHWVTESTDDAGYFILQRSQDGIHWTNIDYQLSFGRSSFTYTDNNALCGNNYYRLQIQDSKGKITYSNIDAVYKNIKTELSVISCGKGSFKINVTNNTLSGTWAWLYSSNGQLIKSLKLQFGANNLFNNILPGLYLLKTSALNMKLMVI